MSTHSIFSSDTEIDQVLKQLVEPPADLDRRIIAACHATSEALLDEEGFLDTPAEAPATAARPSFRRTWRATVLPMAAAAAVAVFCACVTTFVLRDRNAPAVDAPVRFAAAKASAPTIAAAPAAIADAAVTSAGQAFSLRDSQRLHASFSGNASEGAAAASTSGSALHHDNAAGTARQELPDTISQVWLTHKTIPTQAQLETLTDRLPGCRFTLDGTDSDGCTTIRIVASDAKLQEIVDTLHNHTGLTLLSPSLPQPGEAAAVAFHGKSVTYIMKLLKE